jgi:hypothetical protein
VSTISIRSCELAKGRDLVAGASEMRVDDGPPVPSPLAWDLAQRARFEYAGGVTASISMHTGATVSGSGWTTNEAVRDLALKLDQWAEDQ